MRSAGAAPATRWRSPGLDAHEAAVALARLELLGYVRADGAGRYVRTALIVPGEDGDYAGA